MNIGTQLTAPDGYGELKKDETYHLLRHDIRRGRVLLVRMESSRPSGQLVTLTCDAFESGLASGWIQQANEQHDLPPHLREVEGVNFLDVDSSRRKSKRTYGEMVDHRVGVLGPLIAEVGAILSADDVEQEINARIRALRPQQNESRVRGWFLTYLAFGCHRWALMPPLHRIGHWDRTERESVKKLGRPSIDGGQTGYSCTPSMQEKIEAGFHKFARHGVPMTDIYGRTMISIFGCKVVTLPSGDMEYRHPEGHSFPSINQFRYWCERRVTHDEIQKTLYGEQRVRNRLRAPIGRYSTEVANLMEKVEQDAYSTDDFPSGFTDERPNAKVYVVELSCVASGMGVGIGFSWGAETGDAYRAAMFCAAVDKVRFCALFGISIEPQDWPSIGMTAFGSPDRGPGASDKVLRSSETATAIVEMPPSFTPQSHATVESMHPKAVKVSGRPKYRVSHCNAVAMARREIWRLIRNNKTRSAQARMTPDMLSADIVPSPLGIWNYLDARGRNDGQRMSFDDAVRTCLQPIEFDVVRGVLMLRGWRYGSKGLNDTGVLDQLRRRGKSTLKGYVLELCVRHSWVEVRGKLIQVDAALPLRDDPNQLYMSLQGLDERREQLLRARRRCERNRPPGRSQAELEFEAETGIAWDDGETRTGRAKVRTPAANFERQALKSQPARKGGL